MSVSILEKPLVAPLRPSSMDAATASAAAMSRPQVGIERLPARRMNSEPRESMNCKSCRKRKIKCNRLRPSCEACQVFQCACIYDAVPKKRGPKTDVLEALLKRVDGLEQRLKNQKKDGEGDDSTGSNGEASSSKASGSPDSPGRTGSAGNDGSGSNSETATPNKAAGSEKAGQHPKDAPRNTDSSANVAGKGNAKSHSSTEPSEEDKNAKQTEALLDTYFARFHAKPFHILDESSFRQRLQLKQIPSCLLDAICALTTRLSFRYSSQPNGYQANLSAGDEYARRARAAVDTDEPSVDALQALLLLTLSSIACGKGKKAFMLLTNAIGMAMALELHREMDAHTKVRPVEREMRRRLFWACYLLDRFMSCGSKRPAMIDDRNIILRLPYWSPAPGAMPVEGDFFQGAVDAQYLQGGGVKRAQGSSSMLIDISRILGITNRYLAAGGVKGDSHFPWHSLSNLSKIRHELDIWAAASQDIFSSVESLFGQPDSTTLVISKLIYHLIHCLIYRPFLPVDLAELSGTGQHQSWQIEATNMCFLHANAIAELVELGRQVQQVDWSAFVGYCICTAGTVHVHGAHYSKSASGGEVFAASAEFLSREMQQLNMLRYTWTYVQHHYQTLQVIYKAHAELISSMANNPTRFAPVFHLEDFFDRYANLALTFDVANLSLTDATIDFTGESYSNEDVFVSTQNNTGVSNGASNVATAASNKDDKAGGSKETTDINNLAVDSSTERPRVKRKKVTPSNETTGITSNSTGIGNRSSEGTSNPASNKRNSVQGLQRITTPLPSQQQQENSYHTNSYLPQTPSNILASPASGVVPSPTIQPPPVPNELAHNETQPFMGALNGYSIPSHTHQNSDAQVDIQQQIHLQSQQQNMQQQPQQQLPHQEQRLSSAPTFNPAFTFPGTSGQPGSMAAQSQIATIGEPNGNLMSYDPMFGTIPTNAFTSPAPWPGDDGSSMPKPAGFILQHSPDGRSNDGSISATAEEKDPFLSLLEQLAENEYARGPGSELDFFLTGNSTSE